MAEAIERDAHALLETYDSGAWRPAADELALAGSLARTRWSGTAFRAALREASPAVREGALVDVLDPATAFLELTDTSKGRSALLALRQLVDALATE